MIDFRGPEPNKKRPQAMTILTRQPGNRHLARGIVAALLFAIFPITAQSQDSGDRVRFRDVAAQAGIDFMHTNGRAGELYVIEVKGSGVAFIDYDNDDDLDLYAVNGNNLPGAKTDLPPINHLYRNDGDGTFTDVTDESGVGDGGYGHGVAIADYDNDGDADMYVANYGPNVLYRNNGDGTFTDVTGEAGVAGKVWSASAAFCDFDNDGMLDLYVANYLVFDINSPVRLPNGPGFYDGETDVLYMNNGDGTFSDMTGERIGNPNGKGLGVVCFDYDDDGDLEIYVANDNTENLLYENKGDGYFEDVTLFSGTGVNAAGETQAGMGVDAGDYDNDGDMDLFVTNYKGDYNTLMRNDGGGMFTDVSARQNLVAAALPYVTFGTAFFDADNDSDLDIYVANGHTEEYEPDHAQPDQLFENTGDGRYEDVSHLSGAPFSAKHVGRGVAFGDYDNDGDIDMVVSNKNGPLNVLQNVGGNRNNWLMIRAEGTESNRDGIGARIEVSAPGMKRIKDVKSGYSMFSANDLRVHFGLGDLDTVDVSVRWPSGIVDEISDVPANHLLTITEGSGSGSVSELVPLDTAYTDDGMVATASDADPAAIEETVERLAAMIESRSATSGEYLLAGPSLRLWMADRTERRYAELLAPDPDNVDLLREYALFMRSREKLDEALDLLERAIVLRPRHTDFHRHALAWYMRKGDFESAVASARNVLDAGDDSPAAMVSLGTALAASKDWEAAEAVLVEALERDPRHFEAYLRLGNVYVESGQSAKAVEAYVSAVRIDPASREARYQLAEAYRRQGELDAYEYQLGLYELLETESGIFKGGMRREDEIELLKREIRMNPLFGRTRADRQLALRYGELNDVDNRDLYSLRGRSSTLKDEMEQAIDVARRLLQVDPSADTRMLFEELNTFRVRFVNALNESNGYDAVASDALTADGTDALAAGDYDGALAKYRLALLENPDNAAAFRGLARVYATAGLGLGPALGLARKAVLVDQSPDSYALLAEILTARGETAAAQRASDMAARN